MKSKSFNLFVVEVLLVCIGWEMINILRIINALKEHKTKWRSVLLLCITLAAITAIGQIIHAHFIGLIGETVGYYEDLEMLTWFLVVLAGITLIRIAAAMISALVLGRWQGRVGFSLREIFMNYMLLTPISELEKNGGGEYTSIYSNDIPNSSRFVTEGGLMVVSSLLNFGMGLAYMIWLHPFYTLLFFCFLPVVAILALLLSLPMGKFSEKVSKETANMNVIIQDSLLNVANIAIYSLEDRMEQRFVSSYDNLIKHIRYLCVTVVPLGLVAIMAVIGPVAFINTVAGMGVIEGEMTLAAFIAFTGIAMQVAGFLMSLAQSIGQLAQLGAGAKRFSDNTAGKIENSYEGDVFDANEAEKGISFKNVSFTYGNGTPNVLESVSFNITPGSSVAIIGGSGSGKSTILKLLMGVYQPTEGVICIGGKDISELSPASLRSSFAYVPQDCFLFPESIHANIVADCVVEDKDNVEKSAFDAGVLDFVNSLPERFDTLLIENAENVSGGQRQRIAIARALYKNAPILLLDEATSSLDPTTEADILSRFHRMSKGMTTVMVAHRPSVINKCDCIIVVDNGRIVAMGTNEELQANNALYRRLNEAYHKTEK